MGWGFLLNREAEVLACHFITSGLILKNPMGCFVFPSSASSDKTSPTTGANLKPCPEKPAAKQMLGNVG